VLRREFGGHRGTSVWVQQQVELSTVPVNIEQHDFQPQRCAHCEKVFSPQGSGGHVQSRVVWATSANAAFSEATQRRRADD
jgi:hypothetical protein